MPDFSRSTTDEVIKAAWQTHSASWPGGGAAPDKECPPVVRFMMKMVDYVVRQRIAEAQTLLWRRTQPRKRDRKGKNHE